MFDFNRELNAINYIKRELSDLSGLTAEIRDKLVIPEVEKIFSTDGLGTWRPTTRTNPILRDTLRLYESLTDVNSPDFIIETGRNYIRFSSENSPVFYHDWHEEGPSKYQGLRFPARPVIGLFDFDDTDVDDAIADYINGVIDRSGSAII